MKPVVLDTDIGDDVDDALALAMILGLPELDVLGITTVHAEVELRARITAKMLAIAGRPDIPVAIGLGQPMNREPRYGWAQSEGQCLSGDEAFGNIVATPGVQFMKELILGADEPVTLLAIGPLTNVARLLLDHPEVRDNLEELVIMGGLFERPLAEYNIVMDPEAAKVVFGAGLPMRAIPFDVTEHCLMSPEMMTTLATETRPFQSLVWELIGYWQKQDGRTVPVLHDPLAVGCLVAPELYTFESVDVTVGLDADRYGMTASTPNPASPVQVCTGYESEGFHSLFEEQLLAVAAAEGR